MLNDHCHRMSTHLQSINIIIIIIIIIICALSLDNVSIPHSLDEHQQTARFSPVKFRLTAILTLRNSEHSFLSKFSPSPLRSQTTDKSEKLNSASAFWISSYVYLWWPNCGLGVDSACIRNEYKEYILGVKAAGTNLQPSWAECHEILQPWPPGNLRTWHRRS